MEKVEVWTHLIEVLSGVACRHPQTTYTGLKKYLHKEWDLVQRVTSHIGEAFRSVEESLEKSFIRALFKGATVEVPKIGITRLPVKQAGLAILNPTLSN